MTPYDDWMRLALGAAALAPAHGDVPVGAVVVGVAGDVLGTGHNDREGRGDPTAHAEVLALRAAAAAVGSWRLAGCTLVVT
nr:deaminase [Actinomycetota bacterium]